MIWRAADGIVAFLARGLIAAERSSVAGGRIGTISALSLDVRVLRVGLQCGEAKSSAVALRERRGGHPEGLRMFV
jgi:hypothetical protein